MMPLMYEIPSRTDVAELVITPKCVTDSADPVYITKETVTLDSAPKISGVLEE